MTPDNIIEKIEYFLNRELTCCEREQIKTKCGKEEPGDLLFNTLALVVSSFIFCKSANLFANRLYKFLDSI